MNEHICKGIPTGGGIGTARAFRCESCGRVWLEKPPPSVLSRIWEQVTTPLAKLVERLCPYWEALEQTKLGCVVKAVVFLILLPIASALLLIAPALQLFAFMVLALVFVPWFVGYGFRVLSVAPLRLYGGTDTEVALGQSIALWVLVLYFIPWDHLAQLVVAVWAVIIGQIYSIDH